MTRIERDIIKGMRQFLRKLKRGIPIEATRIERHDTPDGPMHVRKHVVLNTKRKRGRDE